MLWYKAISASLQSFVSSEGDGKPGASSLNARVADRTRRCNGAFHFVSLDPKNALRQWSSRKDVAKFVELRTPRIGVSADDLRDEGVHQFGKNLTFNFAIMRVAFTIVFHRMPSDGLILSGSSLHHPARSVQSC